MKRRHLMIYRVSLITMIKTLLKKGKKSIMKHTKHLRIGLSKIVILLLSILMIGGASFGSEYDYFIVEKKIRSTIAYPQIESSAIDTENVNKTIKNNLFGPYTFLEDENIAIDMNYEITYYDKEKISICYTGTYVFKKEMVANFGFGLTVDIKSGNILTISDLFSSDDIEKIEEHMYQQNFKIIYGAIGNGAGKIGIEEALENQMIIFSEENRYQFCLGEETVNMIIFNLPTYLGNYSILQIPL